MGFFSWFFGGGKNEIINRRSIRSEEIVGDIKIQTEVAPDGGEIIIYSVTPPEVDGIPTYEHADSNKDNLDIMLRCCEAELKNFSKSNMSPAPFYFWRVAVLAKKQKNYALEVEICEKYLAIVERLKKRKSFDPQSPGVVASPSVRDLEKRLPKAKENLTKQQAGKKP